MPYLPFKMEPFDIALIAGTAVIISFVATVYPSKRASDLDPVGGLPADVLDRRQLPLLRLRVEIGQLAESVVPGIEGVQLGEPS